MTAAAADLGLVDTTTVTRREPRQRWGLRRRITLIFTLGAFVLSLFLAFVTYGFARSSVLQQREDAALDAAQGHAQTVKAALGSNATNAQAAIARLEDVGAQRWIVLFDGQWTSGQPGYDQTELPQALVDRVITDVTASYMRVQVGSELNIVVGYPMPNNAAYFEFFSLDDVTDTLRSVRLSLMLGTIITTVLGVLAGQFAARGAPYDRLASPPKPPRRSPEAVSTLVWNRPRIPT